jgi:hypothetical protein
MAKSKKPKQEYDELYLFEGKRFPDHDIVRKMYEDGIMYNQMILLSDNVRVNEDFVIGKQWEGVEANGLPTPQVNILKRVVLFTIASITSDNIKVNATALANTVGTSGYKELVNILNEEFEAIFEQNNVPSLIREFMRNAAVDGDGCIYIYWDDDAENGQKVKGRIKMDIVENTRVFFGNPQNRSVQDQDYIIMAKREPVRKVRMRAKENDIETWRHISSDYEEDGHVNDVKSVNDLTTVMVIFWRDDETDEIWCYECTKDSTVKEPFNMNIKMFPFAWLNWDYVQDSYHGQAMVTGLIPNQVFINKTFAMTMLSIMKSAFSKVVYDKTKISKWDNRVGSAIGVNGNVNDIAKTIDPAPISPQIAQYIEMVISKTEESLGATSVALGDTRPDNTSAIIALQRAAATPQELTKQNMYRCIEDVSRICLEFMGEYYGVRYVDSEPTDMEKQAVMFAQQMNPNIEMPESVPVEFDFKILKDHPVIIKLDVGSSTYYSEIASMQTLDNLLRNGHITIVDYLERIPDDYVPGRRALLEKKQRELEAQQMAMGMMPPAGGGMEGQNADLQQKMDIPNTGGGFGALQRKIQEQGDTRGLV